MPACDGLGVRVAISANGSSNAGGASASNAANGFDTGFLAEVGAAAEEEEGGGEANESKILTGPAAGALGAAPVAWNGMDGALFDISRSKSNRLSPAGGAVAVAGLANGLEFGLEVGAPRMPPAAGVDDSLPRLPVESFR